MRVCLGPVAPVSADAWTGWARQAICDLRAAPPGRAVTLPLEALDDVASYVEAWAEATRRDDVLQWQVDVDPDELEYLTNALYNLDACVAEEARHAPERSAPAEARAFHLMLVQAHLFALAQDSPSRAAFVEQLRPCWPVAADAR